MSVRYVTEGPLNSRQRHEMVDDSGQAIRLYYLLQGKLPFGACKPKTAASCMYGDIPIKYGVKQSIGGMSGVSDNAHQTPAEVVRGTLRGQSGELHVQGARDVVSGSPSVGFWGKWKRGGMARLCAFNGNAGEEVGR